MKPLYEFPAETQDRFIEGHLNCGKLVGRTQGSFGEVFFLGKSGQRFAAKCPSISRFGRANDAREALEKAIYEVENTRKCQRYPGIHGFAPPVLVLGWPFFLSKRRDDTLSKIIAASESWNHLQKITTLVQIAHALNYCRSAGLVAHQDLKPDNIFIDRLRLDGLKTGGQASVVGITTITYVADFGVADAFRHIGRNSGSKPYMAPEQYSASLLVDGSKIDVFALGVIAFECFTGGIHPVGVRTADVWSGWADGKQSKWDREGVWKNWARRPKDLAALIATPDMPERIKKLIGASLSIAPAERPDMEEFENDLWLSLKDLSPEWAQGVRMQIEANFDCYAPPEQFHEWPYMDECIAKLRAFYSELP